MDKNDLESHNFRPDSDESFLIHTTDDSGQECYLTDSGLSLLVNIIRISQHWGRPAYYYELDENMQREVRLWSRALLTEDHNEILHCVRKRCNDLLEQDTSD